MKRPVTAIRNIGPATETQFHAAGITSADEIEAMGCDAAYTILIKAGAKPHFMAYIALWMGLEGRPFNSITAEEKKGLKQRFETIKANSLKDTDGLEAFLDQIGIKPDP